MNSKILFYISLVATQYVIADDYDELGLLEIELKMADFDFSDAYDGVSEATKNAILGLGFEKKITAEKKRAKLMRTQSARNKELEREVDYYVERNWTLLTKTGDVLLPEEDFSSLADFHNAIEQISYTTKIPCADTKATDCYLGRQEILNILSSNRNATLLNQTWSAWQGSYGENESNFSETLQLVNKAFLPNEEHNAMSYWEMLSEYPDGYAKAQTLWEEVEPLYQQLHDFVRVRLFKFYNITQNEITIPVYLLGSNFGEDWSNIADIVLPHTYLYEEIKDELQYQTVKDIYKLTESSARTMGLNPLGKSFWAKSNFNFTSCGPYVLSYCDLHYTEVLTCKKLGWKEYLDIHQSSMVATLRNQDYYSLARREVRFSAVDSAMQGLSALLAIDNLERYNFVPKNSLKLEEDMLERKNTALLLAALRFLPQLPYYLLSDLWRLEELQYSYNNCTEQWWEKRKQFQRVEGNTNLEADFLGDPFITSNKPHLSKFLGIFLQFQLYDHFKKFFSTENGTLVDFIAKDENFRAFINDRPNKDWLHLVSFNYGFEAVSSEPLLEFFKPLQEYMKNASLDQVKVPLPVKVRTTKAPTITTRRTKPIKKQLPTLKPQNISEVMPKARDIHEKANGVETSTKVEVPPVATDKPVTQKASSENAYVLGGIAGVICVGGLLMITVKRLKRRRRKAQYRAPPDQQA